MKAASLNGSEPKHGKARAGKDGGLEDAIDFECVWLNQKCRCQMTHLVCYNNIQ